MMLLRPCHGRDRAQNRAVTRVTDTAVTFVTGFRKALNLVVFSCHDRDRTGCPDNRESVTGGGFSREANPPVTPMSSVFGDKK